MNWREAANKVVEELPGNVGIFVGAGLSRSAGLRTWKELVQPYAEELDLSTEDLPAPRVMQYYCGNDKAKRSIVVNRLKKEISKAKVTPSHRLIAKLRLPRIWTTNYDSLLEDAYAEETVTSAVITRDSDLAGADYNRSQIVKMHGSLAAADTEIVLLESDYEGYDAHRSKTLSLLEHDLRSKSFVFLGVSFDDPNLQKVSAAIWSHQEVGKPHFLLTVPPMASGDPADLRKNKIYVLWKKDLTRFGVEVVELGSYDEVEPFLHELVKRTFAKTAVVLGKLEPPQYGDLCRSLGEALASNGYRIRTGGGPNVGPVVAEGAWKRFAEMNADPIDKIEFFYKEGGGSTNPRRGRIVYFGRTRSDARMKMISSQQVCIVIGGEQADEHGIAEEVAVARIKGARLVPVAFTGGIANAVWEEEKHLYEDSGRFLSMREEFQALNKPSAGVSEVVTSIIKLCDFLITRRYP